MSDCLCLFCLFADSASCFALFLFGLNAVLFVPFCWCLFVYPLCLRILRLSLLVFVSACLVLSVLCYCRVCWFCVCLCVCELCVLMLVCVCCVFVCFLCDRLCVVVCFALFVVVCV